MIDKNWLDQYQYQIDLAEAGIREQRTEIHVRQRQIEVAERRISEYEEIIRSRRELLSQEGTDEVQEQ